MIVIDRRKSQERRWWNERRGHVPIIDRLRYPAITENADPVVRIDRERRGAGDN